MSADRHFEQHETPSPLQVGIAWILDAVRRLSDAIRELPHTEREWPGGR